MLRGITVLDLATVGPSARASRWLADYGARVVKVSSTHRTQIVPPFYAYSAHRGMERVSLDLSTPEGIETFMGLVEESDVVIESFRPGVMASMGLGYDDVKARNPRIIYCSTTGYGQDGPRAQWAGHDLNYLAVGGFLDCSGRGADGRPPIPGATVADSAGGGMNAVIGILAALVQRAATGAGAYLDVSAADGVLALMALQVDEHLATGVVPGPGHGILTGRYACYGVYGCSDGKWLTVAAIEPKFWANLCRGLGLERWTDFQLDDVVQDEIRADVEAVFRMRPRDEWVHDLAPADTCVAPVLSVPELVADEQFAARHAFVWATDQDHEFRQVGWVLAGSGTDA
jgi:alpha-methylacyl-CoA racemase